LSILDTSGALSSTFVATVNGEMKSCVTASLWGDFGCDLTFDPKGSRQNFDVHITQVVFNPSGDPSSAGLNAGGFQVEEQEQVYRY
jgi:hypothetical protein